jgi:large repetitive protein
VQSDGTSVSLKSSTSQAGFGQAITFTATVRPDAPGGDTPTGSVTFYDGSNDNLGGATLIGGTATLTIHNLPIGTDAITAGYNGDSDFVASFSLPLEVTINSPAPPTYGSVTRLTASKPVATLGQPVKLTATVKPAGAVRGTPKGYVTFMNRMTSLGTYRLRDGKATHTISTLPLGTDAIQAIYSGDQQLSGSPSNIVDEMIDRRRQKRRQPRRGNLQFTDSPLPSQLKSGPREKRRQFRRAL